MKKDVKVAAVKKKRNLFATHLLTVCFIMMTLTLLSGCNTVQGVGQDVSATGRAITHAAR